MRPGPFIAPQEFIELSSHGRTPLTALWHELPGPAELFPHTDGRGLPSDCIANLPVQGGSDGQVARQGDGECMTRGGDHERWKCPRAGRRPSSGLRFYVPHAAASAGRAHVSCPRLLRCWLFVWRLHDSERCGVSRVLFGTRVRRLPMVRERAGRPAGQARGERAMIPPTIVMAVALPLGLGLGVRLVFLLQARAGGE